MKKLTKQSLDELAKEMPVLSEEVQISLIGGAKYFDLSGTFLGDIGPGDEMRIISPNEFQAAMADYNNHPYDGSGQLYGQSLSSASRNTKHRVLLHYAKGGLSHFNLVNLSQDIQAGWNKDGQFMINLNGFFMDHEQDIINTMVHEMVHYNAGSGDNSEYAAYMAQISHPSYALTSLRYKKYLAECLMSNFGYTQEEAERLAKVN